MSLFTRLLILAALLGVTVNAFAYTVPVRRDLKPASQQMIEKYSVSGPVATDDSRLLNDRATSDSSTTTVTSFLAQPDVPRALVITPGGSTADVPAGDITVTGTNLFGETITETFTLTANQATAQNGLVAFDSVSSIVFPIQDGPASTYDVGVLDVLGLHRCMSDGGQFLHAAFNGTKESTAPTLVTDADEVEKNTVDLDSALDGSSVDVYFMQNFQCLP